MPRGPGFPGAGFTTLVQRAGALGSPPLLFDPDLCAFTPSMDKRLSPGPFYTAPIHQGNWDGSGTPDVVTYPRGDLIGNQAQLTYADLDPYQGTFALWITPEWDVDESGSKYFFDFGTILLRTNGADGLWFSFHDGGSWNHVDIDITAWVAGTPYLVVGRWDTRNTIDGTNGMCLSANNAHTYGIDDLDGEASEPIADMYLGCSDTPAQGANAIVEGFTLYRRVLMSNDGYGVMPMNGNPLARASDELTAIYAAGAGVDPTLVTGSEDVCACVPTNSTAEALTSGDGEAWSWPWTDNLPDVWGAWDGGLPGTDRCVEFNATTTGINCGSNVALDNLPDGANGLQAMVWFRADGWGEGNETWLIGKCSAGAPTGWAVYLSQSYQFQMVFQYATVATTRISAFDFSPDGKWHCLLVSFESVPNGGDGKIYAALDGRWAASYTVQSAAAGAITSDAADDLTIGQRANGAYTCDGAIAWSALWNNVAQYPVGTNFISPRAPPAPGGNLVEAWWMDEGTGVTCAAQVNVGAPPGGCDGTIANGSWSSIWAVDGTPLIPYSVEFFQQNDGLDFGSGVNIDNLPAGDCTIEFWGRFGPEFSTSTDVYILSKYSAAGWRIYLQQSTERIYFRLEHATDALPYVAVPTDNLWHHYALDWDVGTLTARLFMDGILRDTDTAVGAYLADAAITLYVNAAGALGNFDGGDWAIGPIRLSNNRRYVGASFVPPDRVNWLANDANAHLLTLMRDGAGATVTDISGNAYHGTITFGADTKWHITPDMEYDEPGAPVHRDGYNFGADGANEGIYIEQAVDEETDWVVFPYLAYDADARAQAEILVRDMTAGANIVTFLGPRLTGVDNSGGGPNAFLTDTGGRWIADALIGCELYNITLGTSGTITDNTETTVTAGINFTNAEAYYIVPPRGSCRWPWNESFCFRVPTGCLLVRIRVLNARTEGVIQVHQVQVLPNLLANGDHESLQGGNPDLITAWANVDLDAGDTQSSAGGGAVIHAGAEALQWNVGADGEGMQYIPAGAVGSFYAMGLWAYGDAVGGDNLPWLSFLAAGQGSVQYSPTVTGYQPASIIGWQHASWTGRAVLAACTVLLNSGDTPAGARYSDDVYMVALNPITLTVTPRSYANSLEATGLCIDGRDDCQQPIPVGYWSSVFGVAMWDWTPRHDDADAVAFGNTPSYVFWASAPIANYVLGRWSAANTLQVEVNDGAASNAVWNTGGGAVLAGTTYKMMLVLTGANVFLFVDGVLRVTVAPAGGFNFGADIPTTMWWGAEPTPSLDGDATFARP